MLKLSHSPFFLLLAWAHLILYGEEATKKAEKEGEEAVAIWEQEQKDIAEGKIVEKDKASKKIQPMVKKAGTGIKAESKPKGPGRRTPVKKDTNKSTAKRKVGWLLFVYCLFYFLQHFDCRLNLSIVIYLFSDSFS